jgi:hypothetical protein
MSGLQGQRLHPPARIDGSEHATPRAFLDP